MWLDDLEARKPTVEGIYIKTTYYLHQKKLLASKKYSWTEEGRKEAQWRKEGRKEGRKERRNEGTKEGRKEGRSEGITKENRSIS